MGSEVDMIGQGRETDPIILFDFDDVPDDEEIRS